MTIARKEELDIVSFLANSSVRSATKSLVKSLPMYSPMTRDLLEFYQGCKDNYSPEDGPLRAFLIRKKYTDAEIELAVIRKNQYMDVSTDGVNELIDSLVDYYKRTQILNYVGKFRSESDKGDDTAEDNLIKGLIGLENVYCKHLDMIDFSEVDSVKGVMDAELGEPIPSVFSVVNSSNSFGSYLKGMLVQVNAPPGIGKTTLMLYEACYQAMLGFKVLYCAIGDMMQADLVVKCIALFTDTDYRKVIIDPDHYMTDEVRKWFRNMRFLTYAAGEIDASNLSSAISNIPSETFDPDTIFIDYDLNFKKVSDSMYDQGGLVYDEMSKLARKKGDYKLVLVASQIKTEFWGVEIVPEKCSAESSRKQHIIDMMININLNQKFNQIGTINIPKQRRGDIMQGKFRRSPSGRFIELSMDEYRSAEKTCAFNHSVDV